MNNSDLEWLAGEESTPAFEERTDEDDDSATAECYHACTSNCRREGCNCLCGEYHIVDAEVELEGFPEMVR